MSIESSLSRNGYKIKKKKPQKKKEKKRSDCNPLLTVISRRKFFIIHGKSTSLYLPDLRSR